MERIELTREQREIMAEFYSVQRTSVIFNKPKRNELWKKAISRSFDLDFQLIKRMCPALEHQIRKSYETGNNIQSAVFSECVYAQTFANMLKLTRFVNCYETDHFIPESVERLLASYHLVPRYVYSTDDKRRMLIQAGGCDGIDSALITVIDLVIYTIEFKEPGAKTSEPDLPKYGEDGFLTVTEKWLAENPQFKAMLDEQRGLNFFEAMGRNINSFSRESVDIAVSCNYTGKKKFADVIVTEDIRGDLVMLPTNQASMWADIEGEIRPAGRNHYKVWTPNALVKFLHSMGATIDNDKVTINLNRLEERRERGGNRRLSGYKITPLFFVYAEDCVVCGQMLNFDINNVRQLNPTIAGKMFFKRLLYGNVKVFYGFYYEG